MSHVKLVYDSDKGVMVPKGSGDQATTQRKTRRICYVDDSRTSTYVTSKMLRQYGYELSHFTTGEAALDSVLEQDYDLLLTDLNMSGDGGLNGDDLIRIIRNCGHPSKVAMPIIVITGSSDGDTIEGLYGAGADEVMVKPVKGKELDAVIKNLIGSHEGEASGADDSDGEQDTPAQPSGDAEPASLPNVKLDSTSETIPILEDTVLPPQAPAATWDPYQADDGSHADSSSATEPPASEPVDNSTVATPPPAPQDAAPGDELSKLLDGFLGDDAGKSSAEPPADSRNETPTTAAPEPEPEPFAWQRTTKEQPAPVETEARRQAPEPEPPRPQSPAEEDNPLLAMLDELEAGGKGAGNPFKRQAKPATSGSGSRMVVMLAAVAIAVAAGVWNFKEPIPQVRLAEVAQGAIFESISVPGKVVSKRKVELSAYYPGLIESVEVREGDTVKKGQVLVRLDGREASTRVKRAEANLLSAQEEVALTSKTQERMMRALDVGAVSRQMVEDAEAEWKAASARQSVAEEELAAARLTLERMNIMAPFEGLVTSLAAHAGAWTAPPESLLTLVDVTQREVEVTIDATDSARLRLDQTVVLSSDAFPDKSWKEKIMRIAPAASRNSAANTIDVYVSLGKGAPSLRVGQQVDAEIRTRANNNALKVPFEALFTHDGTTTVAVVEDGLVRFVPVVTGIEDFTHVEIVKGLAPGQSVILGGAKGLEEGAKVRVAG